MPLLTGNAPDCARITVRPIVDMTIATRSSVVSAQMDASQETRWKHILASEPPSTMLLRSTDFSKPTTKPMTFRAIRLSASIILAVAILILHAWVPTLAGAKTGVPNCGEEFSRRCLAMGCTLKGSLPCASGDCLDCVDITINLGVISWTTERCVVVEEICRTDHS